MGPIRLLFKTYRQHLAQRFADGTVSAVFCGLECLTFSFI